MYIDTHCHLTDERFEKDYAEVIMDAKKNGIEAIIMPTTFPEDIQKGQTISEKFDSVYFLAGIHPEEVENIDIESALSLVKVALEHPKCLGIGEIGLDFYFDTEKKTLQRQVEVFTRQLQIALDKNVPVVIHSRSATKETQKVLDQFEVLPKGQFHCWGENEDFLRYVLDKQFFVSFCGNLTFKNAQNLRDLCQKVPTERLLLETDAPYLAPEGHRGTRNTPTNVIEIAKQISILKDISLEEIARMTTRNTQNLFGI